MGEIPSGKIMDLFPEELEGMLSARKEGAYEIIDVRQPQEYTKGHIPGAKLIPLGEIEERMDEFSTDQDLLFYCRSGARSMAAASLVRDTGVSFRGIYNLVGGYGGYEGTGLVGMPRLDTIDLNLSLHQIIVRAIDMEKGAWRFYTLFQERFPDAGFTPRLHRLVELEKKHGNALYTYWEKHVQPGPEQDFESLFASLDGEILEGGESLDDWTKRLESMQTITCLDLAEAALVIEYSAYDLYRNLADRATGSAEITFFRLLSEQEKGHVRMVSKVFEDCYQEDA
ncbi:MAG: rhodanese-like domain-containing protein [Desulfoplanes sp.]|nr:rhodanese-like domain-containing protein [Desulfoplanes sp.]